MGPVWSRYRAQIWIFWTHSGLSQDAVQPFLTHYTRRSRMRIGIPKEVKNHEYRVALTPAGVHELTVLGHDVFVERGAGTGSAITDGDYGAAGAKILNDADQVWATAELVLKVKEPIAEEYHRLRPDQTLFTYLHLAASEPCTRALLNAGTNSIAYETVQAPDGSLPLLF